MEKLFQLLCGHALGDFAIQPNMMIKGKMGPQWITWMLAHCLIHGGIVYLVTDSLYWGLMEVCFHWLVDVLKYNKYISFYNNVFRFFREN